MNKRVYIVGPSTASYHHLMGDFGFNTTANARSLENIDLLMFTGGTDINPMIYGEKILALTDEPDGERDSREQRIFREAAGKGLPIFGICRGAQLITAMSGGKLVQHLTGHNQGMHRVTLENGKEINVSSSHHQMMLPGKAEHELLAYSTHKLSTVYRTDKGEIDVDKEVEAVFYPKNKALAVQWHPEYVSSKDDQAIIVRHWLEELVK